MDELEEVAAHFGKLAAVLWNRNHDDDRRLARLIADQVKRLQRLRSRPPETPCKRCGRPVPDVPIGRPRAYCESCHPPRHKVPDFVGAGQRIKT